MLSLASKGPGILIAATRGHGLGVSGGVRAFKLSASSKKVGLEVAQTMEVKGHPDVHGLAYSADGKWLLIASTGCVSAYPVDASGELREEEAVHSWLGEHGGSSWEALRSVVPAAVGAGGGSSPRTEWSFVTGSGSFKSAQNARTAH